MIIEIPGYKTLDLDYLVLDYNGTIAVDGLIPPAIKERLLLLGDSFKIYVLTADTHGTAAAMCDGLPLEIMTFPSGSAMNEKHWVPNTVSPSATDGMTHQCVRPLP
jgi:soluble P-type ATPase